MTYTQLVLVALAATVTLDVAILRTFLLVNKAFWTAYAIVLIFQLVTNGLLTGFHIVRYSKDAIVGGATSAFIGDGRFVFAPVEDLLFGFTLVTLTLMAWVWLGRHGVQPQPLAGPPVWRLSSGGDRRDTD